MPKAICAFDYLSKLGFYSFISGAIGFANTLCPAGRVSIVSEVAAIAKGNSAFDYLLKPKRQVSYMRKDHAYFGRQLSYKLEIPDMITEKLYAPFQKRFVGISAFLRRLQQGSVRLYVSYVMAAMVLVLVWGALYK